MPKLTISEKDQNSCNKRKSGKDLWENREQREPKQQSMLACRHPLGSVDGVNNSRGNSAYEFCNQGTGKHYKASTLPLPKEHASNEQNDKIQSDPLPDN